MKKKTQAVRVTLKASFVVENRLLGFGFEMTGSHRNSPISDRTETKLVPQNSNISRNLSGNKPKLTKIRPCRLGPFFEIKSQKLLRRHNKIKLTIEIFLSTTLINVCTSKFCLCDGMLTVPVCRLYMPLVLVGLILQLYKFLFYLSV